MNAGKNKRKNILRKRKMLNGTNFWTSKDHRMQGNLEMQKALMQTQLRCPEEILNLSYLFSLPVLKYRNKFGKIFFPYIGIILIPNIWSINQVY